MPSVDWQFVLRCHYYGSLEYENHGYPEQSTNVNACAELDCTAAVPVTALASLVSPISVVHCDRY